MPKNENVIFLPHLKIHRWWAKIGLLLFGVIVSTGLLGCGPQISPLDMDYQAKEKGELRERLLKTAKGISSETDEDPSITLGTTGGRVRREVLPDNTPTDGNSVDQGVYELTVHLDQGKINRVNARRNPEKIDTNPDLFGIDKIFKPLITIEAKGPGKIILEGSKNTPEIHIPVSPLKEKIEIYPNYNLSVLFGGQHGEKEKINVYFDNGEEKKLIESLDVVWSGPREIFLSDKNLCDLASLSQVSVLPETLAKTDNLDLWLELLANDFKEKKIRYIESSGDEQGWQLIKTPKSIMNQNSANCLDMVLWVSSASEAAGFESYLIAMDGHALVAVAPQGKDLGDAKYIETTLLIEQLDNKPSSLADAIKKGSEQVKEKMEKDPEKILAINLKEWKKYYRENK